MAVFQVLHPQNALQYNTITTAARRVVGGDMQMRSLYLYFEVFVSVQKFSVLITLIFWYCIHRFSRHFPPATQPPSALTPPQPHCTHFSLS
jgi:hypothetical protein